MARSFLTSVVGPALLAGVGCAASIAAGLALIDLLLGGLSRHAPIRAGAYLAPLWFSSAYIIRLLTALPLQSRARLRDVGHGRVATGLAIGIVMSLGVASAAVAMGAMPTRAIWALPLMHTACFLLLAAYAFKVGRA